MKTKCWSPSWARTHLPASVSTMADWGIASCEMVGADSALNSFKAVGSQRLLLALLCLSQNCWYTSIALLHNTKWNFIDSFHVELKKGGASLTEWERTEMIRDSSLGALGFTDTDFIVHAPWQLMLKQNLPSWLPWTEVSRPEAGKLRPTGQF